MSVVIVTGSTGLVGSETVRYYCEKGCNVVGIDNNMRMELFGPDSSTEWMRRILEKRFVNYTHHDVDIRNKGEINSIFTKFAGSIELVVHTAAQPSHDWAANDPEKDFSINAYGTLVLLENMRRHCPDAVFIFTSTNKVYGDAPNRLPLIERDTRFKLDPSHAYYDGVDETMSIDQTMHSLFGASKVAADVLVQEYGRYFGLKTGVFRGGCLTGPAHSGTKLHGFLSYLVRCVITGKPYTIYGYKGKQVMTIHDFKKKSMELYGTPELLRGYIERLFASFPRLEVIYFVDFNDSENNYSYFSGAHPYLEPYAMVDDDDLPAFDSILFRFDRSTWKAAFDRSRPLSPDLSTRGSLRR